MSRFQAQTNAVLDQELDDLRERLALRTSQKADLLREIAALAAWVVRQAAAGGVIQSRRGLNVEPLVSPVLERLRRRGEAVLPARIALDDDEVRRLADVLDHGFAPTPALRRALSRLADPRRRPPRLRWRRGGA
jgi:uncharacterized protein (DUF1778 family)